MSSEMNLRDIERTARRVSQEDGLFELVVGFCLVAMAGRLLSRYLIFTLTFPLFVPWLLIPGLRKRVTYPRVGYVRTLPEKPREVGGVFILIFILIGILAIALVLFGDVGNFGLWVKWFPAVFGVQLAGLFADLASKSGAVRNYVFAGWSVLSGIVLSILNFEFDTAGVFLYFLAMGISLALWGLVLFIRFLHTNPRTTQEVFNGEIAESKGD